METEGEIWHREREIPREREREIESERSGDRERPNRRRENQRAIQRPGPDFRRGRDGPAVLMERGCRRRRLEVRFLVEPRTIFDETLLVFRWVVGQNQFPAFGGRSSAGLR